MKTTFLLLSFLALFAFKSNAQTPFTDPRDGNVYQTVTIGAQVWMAENLRYLPSVVGPSTSSVTTPYYYVYGYDGTDVNAAKAASNYTTYGVLYNWPAACSSCPTGWYLPSDAEWTQFTDYLGGTSIAGGKLKETGTTHWNSPNTGATNETGFTALGGGYREYVGGFGGIKVAGHWWSTTGYNATNAYRRYMSNGSTGVGRSYYPKNAGFSVRCVHGIDLNYTISGNTGIAGVTLHYFDSIDQTVTSGVNGDYSIFVPSGWSGTVTPAMQDYIFVPLSRDYTNIAGDIPDQDFLPVSQDIEIVTNPVTGEIWMDRNLGATQVATSSTDAAAYGDLYQWGRGTDGHEKRSSATISSLATSDTPGHGNFILASNSPYDWRSPQNTNLWQGVSGTNNPCPSGYRLPTEAEWEAERTSWSSQNSAGAFASPLKLPVAGGRYNSSGSLGDVGSNGLYWSSTVDGNYSRDLNFFSSNASLVSSNRAYGYSVRCIHGIDLNYTISGNTGIAGVTLHYFDSIDQTVTSGVNGDYSIFVPYGWSGTLTPAMQNYIFVPLSRDYTNIASDVPDQDFLPVLQDIEINVRQTADIPDGGTFDFGSVNVGDTSNIVTFTIENIGITALELTGTPVVSVTGSGFLLLTDADSTVGAGDSTTFQVIFTPGACDTNSGSISIANNDPDENPYNFTITGIGLDIVPPVIVTSFQDTSVNSGQDCQAPLPDYTSSVVATDDCSGSFVITQLPVAGTLISGTSNMVTLIVLDQAGNSDEVSFNVGVEIVLSTPAPIYVSAGMEPVCQVAGDSLTTTYVTSGANYSGFHWSVSDPAAGSIDSLTGVMTWADGFYGSTDIRVFAYECGLTTPEVTRSVTISQPPYANAGADAVYSCTPVLIGDSANGPGTIAWSPASGLNDTSIAKPLASPTVNTTYVLCIDNNGCPASDTVLVTLDDMLHSISGKTKYAAKANSGIPAPNPPTYNAAKYNIDNVIVILKSFPSGTELARDTSDEDGNYRFCGMPDGTYILSYDKYTSDTMQAGNGMDAIDISLLKYYIGNDTLANPSRNFTAKYKKAANVDNNASINTVDVARISRKIGMPNDPAKNFPKGNWVALDTVVTLSGSDLQVNLKTICYGDFNASGSRYRDSTVNWTGGTPPPQDVTNPVTGEIWMDRNLGATQVATSSTDADAYGDLYQWGRGTDGHEKRSSATTSALATSDTPGHGNFILAYDWRSPKNDNLWQGVSGINNPCPSGYRLPTNAEWDAERLSWSSNNAAGAFASLLKLPMSGYRHNGNGSLTNVGSTGHYWSSTVAGTLSVDLYFNSSGATMYSSFRSDGDAVRCLKD
ncbi:MAG TPA: FISUMP domain-containing protein [Bacteroidales bacterium]|nr:FISUMP domain-containing protein [Bacteroidales bacterium]